MVESLEVHAKPGAEWIAIVRRVESEGFAEAFDADATLNASVLSKPCIGVPAIQAFFAVTRKMYDAIEFVAEINSKDRTVLEWRGVFEGLPVTGVTVLGYTADRRIAQVRLLHEPLEQVERFAKRLSELMA